MLFFLKDNKKEFILWLNVPKVTAYNQMNILILDACRNETRGTVLKQETSFKVPFQTFIAYSTTAGCTASDGLAGGIALLLVLC